MSVRRALITVVVTALIVLIAGSSLGPLSPLEANSAGKNGPSPGCPIVGPAIDIRVDHKTNLSPDVAFDPIHGEWLVVWYTQQGLSVWDIWAARLDPDGQVIQTFNVATSEGVQRWGPVVSFSPGQEQYLVVYARQTDAANPDIYATRVNWDGAWVSAEFPLRVMPDKQYYPEVAYNAQDDEFLVVYTNVWSGGGKDVDAMRVRASDGQIMDWKNVAAGADGTRILADVAYNEQRNEYLIAYDFSSNTAPGSPEIRGKVAKANLDGLSAAPERKLCCDPQASPPPGETSVAAGPDEYLITFVVGGSSPPFYGRWINGTGEPLGADTAFPLTSSAPTSWGGVNAAYAGGDYLATWSAESVSAPGEHDIFGCRVMAGQNRPPDNDFAIEDGAHLQSSAMVACAEHGDCLVVYQDKAPDGQTFRIRGRFLRPCPRVSLPLVPRGY